MSIDDATPEEWNKARKNTTATGKLFHPQDQHTNPITKPDHYNKGGIEAIDYIRQQLGDDGYTSYCLGNFHKYFYYYKYGDIIRYGEKILYLEKSRWYLSKYIEVLREKIN